MEFSNREIATGIIIALGIVLLLAFPKTRPAFVKGIADVLKALFQWKLALLIGLYFFYAAALVALASTYGWWDSSVLSVTILTVFVTGFPLFMNANNYKTGSELVRKVLLEVIGVSALMITYLNLGEFSIAGEVILQLILIPVVVLAAFASRAPGGKIVERFFEIVLVLIAITVLISTTVTVVSEPKTFDWLYEVKSFAVSIWLPIALIPFVYVAALLMQVESALVRLRLHNDREHLPLRVRLALVIGFRGSLRYAKRFSGLWITDMSSQRTFRGGLKFMRTYREAVRARVAEQRTHDRQLRERIGQRGIDEDGLWLDRREFHETREILDDIWFTQAAIFRNKGKYVDEPFLISSFHLKKLPQDHGIEIVLAKNALSWYAWRMTPGGYYFAAGGTKDVDAHWQYDGPKPPDGFPHDGVLGWVNTTRDAKSREWETRIDQPIPLV
jgi:hypothetical protein